MKKYLILLIATILFSPGFVFSDLITFKLGWFIPMANSDLWDDELSYLNFSKFSMGNKNFGFIYEFFLSKRVSLALGLEAFSTTKHGNYKDYVGLVFDEKAWAFPVDHKRGSPLKHEFRIGITPIQVSLKFYPMGRRAGFSPFLGGGGGLYLWSVGIKGQWVVFNDEHYYYDEDLNADIPVYPIDIKAASESKLTIGYHLYGGFMFPVTDRLNFEGEFKLNFAKGKFSDFFVDYGPFDLSGYLISVGLIYQF